MISRLRECLALAWLSYGGPGGPRQCVRGSRRASLAPRVGAKRFAAASPEPSFALGAYSHRSNRENVNKRRIANALRTGRGAHRGRPPVEPASIAPSAAREMSKAPFKISGLGDRRARQFHPRNCLARGLCEPTHCSRRFHPPATGTVVQGASSTVLVPQGASCGARGLDRPPSPEAPLA